MAGKIEYHRPGLGIPIVFANSARIGARYSTLGRGALFCGYKTLGKGEIINASENKKYGQRWEIGDFMGRRAINNWLHPDNGSSIPMKNIAISFEDMSPMISQYYYIENTMGIASWMISNKKYSSASGRGDVLGASEAHNFDSVSFFGGCTPLVLGRIQRRAMWSEMWSDRFSVFCPIRTLNDTRRMKKVFKRKKSLDNAGMQGFISKMIPTLPESVSVDVEEEEYTRLYRLLLKSQHEEPRGVKYLKSDTKGLAILSGSDTVEPCHLAFMELLEPYFHLGTFPPKYIEVLQRTIAGSTVPEVMEKARIGSTRGLLNGVRKLQRYGFLRITVNDGYRSVIEPGRKLMNHLNTIEKVHLRGLELA